MPNSYGLQGPYQKHQGPLCGARKRQGGGTCTLVAGWGTDHVGYGLCKLHGGSVPNGKIHAARQEAAVVFGVPLEIEPHEALLHCVYSAAGRCAALKTRIDTIQESEAFYEAYAQQVLNPWLREYKSAEEALAKYSKMALDAGVSVRAVELAQQQGDELAKVLKGVFAEIDVSEDDMERLPSIVHRHLSALEKPRVPDLIVSLET